MELKRRWIQEYIMEHLFLGLNGIVVKSHGSADSFSYSNAIKTAYYESKNNLIDSIREYTSRELND